MVLTTQVLTHLTSLGFSARDSVWWSKVVSQRVRENGPEVAVQQLKELSVAFKQSWASEERVVPPTSFKSYIDDRGNKQFSDRLLRRLANYQSFTIKTFKKLEGFLRTYQLITVSKVTEKQLDKFMDSVTKPGPEPWDAEIAELHYRISVKTKSLVKGRKIYLGPVVPLCQASNAKAKRSPVFEAFTNKVYTETQDNIDTKSIEVLRRDVDWNLLWSQNTDRVSALLIGDINLPLMTEAYEGDLPVGKIGFIQEPGCKLRAVANPFRAVQILGEPLKLKTKALMDTIKCIYVSNQDGGREKVSSWLESGSVVYSYDSSAFTDRFPYSLQRSVLVALVEEGVIDPFDLSVIDITVNKKWILPGDRGSVRWAVGQPMGFGPSFNLATLTHYLMLACCPGFDEDHVVIVGDDIAMNDTKMAQFYERIMEKLGVEINQSKSIVSPLLAEFCGKVITSDGVIQSKKIKPFEVISITSQLEYYGDHIYFNMKGDMKKAALAYFLPSSLGGTGRPSWLSHQDWLNHLDVEYIQSYTIRQILDDTIRLNCAYGPGEMEAIMREAVLWYEENIPWYNRPFSPNGGNLVLDEITGLTTQNHRSQRDIYHPTNVLDSAVNEDLIHLRNNLHLHNSREVIELLHCKGFVTRLGYVMEKPSDTAGQNNHQTRDNANEIKQKLNLIKRFFRRPFGTKTRSLGKAKTEAPKQE